MNVECCDVCGKTRNGVRPTIGSSSTFCFLICYVIVLWRNHSLAIHRNPNDLRRRPKSHSSPLSSVQKKNTMSSLCLRCIESRQTRFWTQPTLTCFLSYNQKCQSASHKHKTVNRKLTGILTNQNFSREDRTFKIYSAICNSSYNSAHSVLMASQLNS